MAPRDRKVRNESRIEKRTGKNKEVTERRTEKESVWVAFAVCNDIYQDLFLRVSYVAL